MLARDCSVTLSYLTLGIQRFRVSNFDVEATTNERQHVKMRANSDVCLSNSSHSVILPLATMSNALSQLTSADWEVLHLIFQRQQYAPPQYLQPSQTTTNNALPLSPPPPFPPITPSLSPSSSNQSRSPPSGMNFSQSGLSLTSSLSSTSNLQNQQLLPSASLKVSFHFLNIFESIFRLLKVTQSSIFTRDWCMKPERRQIAWKREQEAQIWKQQWIW